jgi:hypothetical protein
MVSVCLTPTQQFSDISWQEQVNFQWDDELDFYSASSLKQQSADIHVAQLWYVIVIPSQSVITLTNLYCMLSGESIIVIIRETCFCEKFTYNAVETLVHCWRLYGDLSMIRCIFLYFCGSLSHRYLLQISIHAFKERGEYIFAKIWRYNFFPDKYGFQNRPAPLRQ